MSITLRQLDIFLRVSQNGHVTRVSEQLLLSQSAVSMAIAELEKQAGAPLFERRGRRLLLNDRGRLILPEVEEVLRRVSLIEDYMCESIEEPVGSLIVGASTTIGNYLLPFIVGEFSKRYPRARAMLQVGNTQQIEAAVGSGEYDIGLIEGPSHHPALQTTIWRDDELVLIAGNSHPWAAKQSIGSPELESAPWIMREEGSGTREIFENAMSRLGIRASISMELGHTEAIKKAVEAGLGVSCLSRLAVQRELDNGWLVEIRSRLDLSRKLIILTRQGEYQTRLLKSYLALLEENRQAPGK